MRRSFISLVALSGIAFAIPSPRSSHVLHEKRAMEPTDWAKSRRVDPDWVLPMRFGLVQSNLDKIEDMLMSVSSPHSPTYGQHFTPEQIRDTFAPSQDTIDSVTEWLVSSGISRDRLRLSHNKGWIHLDATTSEVEDLLKAEYHVYTHTSSGVEQIGCHNYSVPAHVQKHVDLIKPTIQFNHRIGANAMSKRFGGIGKPSIGNGPKKSNKAVTITPTLSTCDKMITLDCLRALYNINYTPVATDKNSFGVVEFTPQAFLPGDLDLFFRNFSPSLVGVRPKSVLIDGAVVQNTSQSFDFNGESDLDLQYAMGLTAPQEVTLLQTGDLSQGAGFDNWLDALDGSFCTFDGGDDPEQDGIYPDAAGSPASCGIINPPNVVSISYGQDEATASVHYATRQCNEYAKLGMLGTTVVYSSGDNGVAGFDNICLDSNHNEGTTANKVFNPEFPASCPFVTAVGATQVNPGASVNDPEGACEQVIFSGGGFSNIFPMPSYQANAVKAYTAVHLTPSPFLPGQFNDSGNARAFPDVAANGANYVIGIDGQFGLVFGTSASAPVFASMITLVNDARLALNKKPLGFINPLLYDPIFAPAFNDITQGGNRGCGTPGFTATLGWDPVTGKEKMKFYDDYPLSKSTLKASAHPTLRDFSVFSANLFPDLLVGLGNIFIGI
ncbi:Aorsin [Psilocybe cubensis]|uniref:Aorsin n=1 Tax=Psilocybe cubensis TaxID=181762 RepID=A0ACB8GY90_PSICU|nr:Aorsin [Psilocybe cubensis]KAH9480397.1 Aorsin [Psilocybe cubensis]